MFRRWLSKLVDVEKQDSFANKVRLKRMMLFKKLMAPLPEPLVILDVGGTESFWENSGLAGNEKWQITILNLYKVRTHYSNLKSVVGDARDLSRFRTNQFKIVFSNSVIEHLGNWDDQKKMAKEVLRVGKRFFLQTPNYYFPIEPHFWFPFFQFLPLGGQAFLLNHFSLGYYKKASSQLEAMRTARSIRLLKKQELRKLFPEADIYEERLLGGVFSFLVWQ
jgi:SAM-dependent methyltransferase